MFRVKESRSAKQAFTLIELIVVIAVIGILVLLAAPKFLGYTKDAKLAQITNDVKAHESAIETERAKNDSFIDDWELVDKAELESYANSGSLFDKKGPIDNDSFEGFSGEHYSVPEGLVNSKLKGDFYLAEGGNVYYNKGEPSEPSEPESQLKTKSFEFDEAVGAEQTHTIELDDLKELKSITSDNGDVEVVSTDGNKVTVKVNNGELVRKEQTGGELIPEDTKYVEFETEGLEEVMRMNDKLREDTGMTPRGHRELDFTTALDGYKADKDEPLSREYVGADYKIVTYYQMGDEKNSDEREWLRYTDGDWVESEDPVGWASSSGFQYYDDEGYYSLGIAMGHTYEDIVSIGGDEKVLDESMFFDPTENINPEYGFYSHNNVKHERRDFEEGAYVYRNTYTSVYHFEGMAVKGGFENARWKYSGEVTKPAEDTRTYDEYYKYIITVEYK